ncbi:MAG: Abi family protein [Prevotella sp.]|nr:Abi family protein [Prevotella sp.]
MQKYLAACNNDTRRAMTLYRYNLQLSQEMFTIISCFEVVLRNLIDKEMVSLHGSDWLRDAILPNGALCNDRRVENTRKIIEKVYNGLMREDNYSHSKLLSEMEFGIWKYMFSNAAYALMGQRLLRIFPNKPISSRQHRYDNTYVFQELDYINKLRNRIAHHEPICFARPNAIIDTSYVLNQYARMMKLFQWMNVNGTSLVYGLDHVGKVSEKVMCI